MTLFRGASSDANLTDLFDTSLMPDDSAHWDELAERVTAKAAHGSEGLGFGAFVHSHASWLAASLLLAAALAFVVLPAKKYSASSFTEEWAAALAPSDDVGRAIVLPERPPAIDVLMLSGQRTGVR